MGERTRGAADAGRVRRAERGRRAAASAQPIGPVAILMFALELVTIAAPAVWAIRVEGPLWLRIASAVVGTGVLVATWAVFGAPRSRRRLAGLAYRVLVVAWMTVGALWYVLCALWVVAIVLVVGAVVVAVATVRVTEEAADPRDPPARPDRARRRA